jgi:hypothetical protein
MFLFVHFKFEININQPVNEVYNFFWSLDEQDYSDNELVPIYELITDGPRRVGSVIREVVKTRYYDMEIYSEITEHVPNQILGYRFQGGGIKGRLRYFFEPDREGTKLIQEVDIGFVGFRKILNPLIPHSYGKTAEWRLKEIKKLLERKCARTST